MKIKEVKTGGVKSHKHPWNKSSISISIQWNADEHSVPTMGGGVRVWNGRSGQSRFRNIICTYSSFNLSSTATSSGKPFSVSSPNTTSRPHHRPASLQILFLSLHSPECEVTSQCGSVLYNRAFMRMSWVPPPLHYKLQKCRALFCFSQHFTLQGRALLGNGQIFVTLIKPQAMTSSFLKYEILLFMCVF